MFTVWQMPEYFISIRARWQEPQYRFRRCRHQESRGVVRLGYQHEFRTDLSRRHTNYVHEDVYDEFVEAYTARLKKIRVGDNFDKDVDQGPQNSKMQYEKILGYIESGKSEGATIHTGGKAFKKNESDKGYFIEPTIFTNVQPNMKIMREEIFGPVVSITKFKTEEEVIELANDTSYGLAAGIFRKDLERSVRVTAALEAGTTWGNMYNFVHWSIPFGGYKESGIGRECSAAALENYTEIKAVYFNMGLTALDAI